MSNYTTTIGLEIHAELKTLTKMFCNSKNDTRENRPNVNICPVCMGHPGTLPTINKEAVKDVLKVGVALGGEIADYSEFDRKNYFYPDIPKGYQISQYKYPLIKGGNLKGVEITRVHLEEDTAKSSHEEGEYSLVDFNRAGVPLMELVTEPVIHSAKQAGDFARELQLLLRTLGVSEADMERGEMRVEANISVSNTDKFGTKVEVKNLNSFRSMERAIEFEVDRHMKLLEKGETIVQETRGFDENKGTTFSQRLKEDSHDYRYFPDPDMPKLKLSEIGEFSKASLSKEMPELPDAKRNRLTVLGIKAEDVEVFVSNFDIGTFFETVIAGVKGDKELIKLSANYIISDLLGIIKDSKEAIILNRFGAKLTHDSFANLLLMVKNRELSSRGAKDILKILVTQGGAPKSIANELGLIQKSDEGSLKPMIEKIIFENPKVVAEYKSGKIPALQFLIGQGMKVSKGSANPEILKKMFVEMIG